MIVAIAEAWPDRLDPASFDVRSLPGCGEYARESWLTFVVGDPPAEPRDREVARFVAWWRDHVRTTERGLQR